ncbi:MAG TPA: hypothetical protein VHJ54_10390 [Solirubrobacterales bacterium]|nr:hypothetical protein [Solirubrobacterales bacterium]
MALEVLVVLFARRVTDLSQRLLEHGLLAAKLGDPLGDQLRLNVLFQGADLGLYLALEVSELLADAGAGALAVSLLLARVSPQLLGELVDPHRAEDALLEESQDQALEAILSLRYSHFCPAWASSAARSP